MKQFIILLFCSAACTTIDAQLTIEPGAQLHISGNPIVTLQDIDLVNNGSFTAGNSKLLFTGNISSAISGSQPVQLYELEINKTAGSSVSLQRAINVSQQINFVAGLLNLNNYNIDLGTTGSLNGESETSRIIGASGGQVLFATTLNNPSGVNPGNLGAIFTSSQNMGAVIIKRGHQSQVNSYNIGSSVLRYYDIAPVNNTGLNAILRFHYFDAELNSFDENTMVFWKSADALHWSNEGFISRNATSNYVEKTGIPSFSRWTLSSVNNPLPVFFILFNVSCTGNAISIIWKTAQEQNSSHFNVERSPDGITWTVINNQPAAGNSSTEKTYTYTDNAPVQKNYYRVALYDIDGHVQYTKVLKANCDADDLLKVWPNPFNEILYAAIHTTNRTISVINIYDNKGALIKTHKTELLPGSNLINLDMKNLSAGMYQFVIEWNNGQEKKIVSVIKY